jgi:hypothetical protein
MVHARYACAVQLVAARREARSTSVAAQHAQSVAALTRERIEMQKRDATTLKDAAGTIESAVKHKTLARQQWGQMQQLQQEVAPKRLLTIVAGKNLEQLNRQV